MKRTILCALTAAILCTGAAQALEPVSVRVEGRAVSGYLEAGTTYVPFRQTLDILGGWQVSWDSAGRSAVAAGANGTLRSAVGSSILSAAGVDYRSTAATFLHQGCTYVPLRSLAAACGLAVRWDGGAVAEYADLPCTAEELDWLSRIISAESRGEPLEGQIAVGNVVLNRVASPDFPNTIREVILDTRNGVQFEPLANGTLYDPPTAQSVAAAKLALLGASTAGKSLYFFAPALSQGTWIRQNRTYLKTIGCHRFYL